MPGITAQMLRVMQLTHQLATELKVNLREYCRPDACRLANLRKIQLAHLITA
jgi:hypothetical protein